MDEALLRAERQRRLGLRVELDAEAVAIELADRRSEVREAAARRVAVVARQERRLPQLLDGDLRRRDVGIAEAEVDHVLAGAAQLELEALDLGECVWREGVDPAELRHAADRRKAPSASRTATTSPITTSAGVGRSSAALPMAPSGATTTCSSSSVPRETTAAGVEDGLPCSISRSASRPTTAAAHEGDERSGHLRERPRVELLDVVRRERGHRLRDAAVRDRDARRLGNGGDRRHAGHELERDAGADERERLLPAAAEHERVAALEAHDAAPAPAVRDEQRVDVFLPMPSREISSAPSEPRRRSPPRRAGRRSAPRTSRTRASPRTVISSGSPGPGTDEGDAHPSASATRSRK